jgi:hypothetical protein
MIYSENLQVMIKLRNGEPLYVAAGSNLYKALTWTEVNDHDEDQIWTVKLDGEKGRYFRFETIIYERRYLRSKYCNDLFCFADTKVEDEVKGDHQWQIEPMLNGSFTIQNRHTDKYLCVIGTVARNSHSRNVYLGGLNICNDILWNIVQVIL